MTRLVIAITALIGILFGYMGSAHAEFKVEVSGVGITQIPIGISEFRSTEPVPQKIAQIISADLDRSGQFKTANPGVVWDENTRPDFILLKQKSLDAMLTGSITKLADYGIPSKAKTWVVKNSLLCQLICDWLLTASLIRCMRN